MIRNLGWIFGVALGLIGIAGFIPGLSTDGFLFGVFAVDPVLNVVHMLTGIIAVLVASGSDTEEYARLYFQAVGLAYALIAIFGFMQGDSVLGIFVTNPADNIIHLATAALGLWAGFVLETTPRRAM